MLKPNSAYEARVTVPDDGIAPSRPEPTPGRLGRTDGACGETSSTRAARVGARGRHRHPLPAASIALGGRTGEVRRPILDRGDAEGSAAISSVAGALTLPCPRLPAVPAAPAGGAYRDARRPSARIDSPPPAFRDRVRSRSQCELLRRSVLCRRNRSGSHRSRLMTGFSVGRAVPWAR